MAASLSCSYVGCSVDLQAALLVDFTSLEFFFSIRAAVHIGLCLVCSVSFSEMITKEEFVNLIVTEVTCLMVGTSLLGRPIWIRRVSDLRGEST